MASLQECRAAIEELAERLAGVDAATRAEHVPDRTLACTVLDLFEEEGILDRVARLGRFLRERVASELPRCPHLGEYRQIGLVGALELVADPGTRAPFSSDLRLGRRIARAALDRAYSRVFSSGTKTPVLAPASTAMLAMVNLSSMGRSSIPSPPNSRRGRARKIQRSWFSFSVGSVAGLVRMSRVVS